MQKKVVLSLGSNVGNRLDNINACIKLIHEKIGVVIQVSKLYETPSWGFDSDSFYNCVLLMHSFYSAEKILQKIQLLEKEMGRKRHKINEYEARLIDIDIVAYGDETITTPSLVIPHPYMEKRRFVLQPMTDLEYEWTHPLLQQTTHELLMNCDDSSECIEIATLYAPVNQYGFDTINFITIEGNIGAGKTSLATKLADDFNGKLVLERFSDNPFLPKFYQDQGRYAFPLEMSFLADRYKQLVEDLSQQSATCNNLMIADYHIFKSLIFAKITLPEEEFRLYKTLFDIIYNEMTKPQVYVYLYQNTERLLKNIKQRGRNYEKNISSSYLEKINQGYLDYIQQQTHLNVIVIDVTHLDFVKSQEDYVMILEQIKQGIDGAK